MTDVVAPVVAALSKADNSLKAIIMNDVFETINEKYNYGKVEIDCNALVIYGEK